MTTDAPWNRPIARWRQRGRVFLWRYLNAPYDYRGWHFTADADGCASLSELLETLRTADPHDGRTVALAPADEAIISAPNYQSGAAPWTSATAWTLDRPPRDEGPQHCVWATDGDRVRLTLGDAALDRLSGAVADVARGEGDYTIELGGETLWAWWFNGTETR